jgi:DNA-binding protein HU-beta
MSTIRKADLVKQVSDSTGIDIQDAGKVIDATLLAIRKNVKEGNPIHIKMFGIFMLKHRKAKKCRDITRNTTVMLPERWVPFLKVSRYF